MEFIPFPELFPKIGKRQIGSFVLEDDDILPNGSYVFVPSFCADKKCDCRRALINAFAFFEGQPAPIQAATISYGWEPRSFYEKWGEGFVEDEMIDMLKGPAIETYQPKSKYANDILPFFIEGILSNPIYLKDLKQQYVYFKYKRKMKMPADLMKLINTVGECPCGSGKIFRVCCGKTRGSRR